MYEQSKAAKRRFNDGAFLSRYFVGRGLDIGAGPDGLSRYVGVFPLLQSVRDWDRKDGDAQRLEGVADGSFDFVHSAHCLEHMVDPRIALANWIRVVRPGGHLVITVPDEDMYERGEWPSRRNSDHKWSFTAFKPASWSPRSINLLDLAREQGDLVEVERLHLVRDFFRPDLPGDQTILPTPECALELVLRRREPTFVGTTLYGASGSLIPARGGMRMKACRRGLMLYGSEDAGEGRLLDSYGECFEAEIALFERLLGPGAVAVDAGAGIGAVAIALARLVASSGRVYAIEPRPRAYRTLVANAALNAADHLDCRNASPGDDDAAIDGLGLDRCRLIRIGIDGAAPAVLRGARDTIDRCRPLIHARAGEPATVPELLAAIDGLGYRGFWHVVPQVRPQSFFGRAAPTDRGLIAVNILAVPPGFAVSGLPSARSPDWRADVEADARERPTGDGPGDTGGFDGGLPRA